MDANRIAHNEFLRALFEWGVVGAAVFIAFIIGSSSYFWRMARAHRTIAPFRLVGGIAVLWTLMLVENVLAGGGNPTGLGAALVFAAAFVQGRRLPPEVGIREWHPKKL